MKITWANGHMNEADYQTLCSGLRLAVKDLTCRLIAAGKRVPEPPAECERDDIIQATEALADCATQLAALAQRRNPVPELLASVGARVSEAEPTTPPARPAPRARSARERIEELRAGPAGLAARLIGR